MQQYFIAPLIGAFVVFLAKDFLIPLISGIVQRAPSIKGESWMLYRLMEGDGSLTPTERLEGPLRIKQLGSNIWVTHNDARPEGKGRVFKYRGVLVGSQAVLTYEEKDASGVVAGTMVFKVNTARDVMTGRSLYWHNDKHKLTGEDYVAKRSRP